MENRIQCIFLVAAVSLFLAKPALAGEPQENESDSSVSNVTVFDPQVERRDVDKDAIDHENFEIGAYIGVISIEDFGTNEVVGATLSYHVTEDLFISANLSESEADLTSAEVLTGISILPDDRTYRHYDISLGFKILPGEGFLGRDIAFTSNLYLLAGLGSTDFAGDNLSTGVIGGGYQVLFNDWLAFNLTLRDYVYKTEVVGSKTASDLEFSTGFTIFF